MSTTRLTCWGGVGAVTGANFLLETGATRLLVDCGLLQGVSGSGQENAKPFPYDPRAIDFLFITHAHLDHIGRIPKLVKEGFKGVIYSTEQTKEMASIMFQDALKIMDQNARQGQVRDLPPLYGEVDVHRAIDLWKSLPYEKSNSLNLDVSVILKDAGHILGSAMYEFETAENGQEKRKKIFFTGDSGNSPSPLLRDTEKITGVDYLIMDSVYGDRNHEPKAERDAHFVRVISETIAAGGALVIPAFSIERTQVILYELNNLVEDHKIPSVPVFLDSPLALKVTDIYKHSTDLFNEAVQQEIRGGDDIFSFPKLKIIHSGFESRGIDDIANPKIILAGSGMSEGGRVVKHEMQYITDPKSTILLMGYQAIGTLGHRIQDKPAEIMIDGEHFTVRARIEMIGGYSSHKDSDNLVEMAADTADTVKKVFVVMGEPKSSLFLVQKLRDQLGMDAVYPERGMVYELK